MYCKIHCKHTFLDHAEGLADSLFTNPLGKYLPPVEKVAHVAFNVLTLGIPLAVYHIFKVTTSLFEKAYDLINMPTPQYCADLSKKAVAFALAELKKHPNIKPFAFSSGWSGPKNTHQPVNTHIALLTSLFWDVAFKRMEEAIKAHKENPWENQEVINAADAVIKIGHTISKMTLYDLPEFMKAYEAKKEAAFKRLEEAVEAHKENPWGSQDVTDAADALNKFGFHISKETHHNLHTCMKELDAKKKEKRTFAQALTKQDSYQYRTFYYASQSYHWARGALGYGRNPHRIDYETAKDELDYLSHIIPEKHAKLYYQAGTIQEEWRTLYNGYCREVRKVVSERELQRADNRHVSWTQEDKRPKTFNQIPDQLPT